MTRKIMIVLALIPMWLSSHSQSLEFVYQEKPIANNAHITIDKYTDDEELGIEMSFYAHIKNKTDQALSVIVRKEEIDIPIGSSNNFCTAGGCFSATKSTPYSIAPQGIDKLFHSTFSPLQPSIATIKYTAEVVGSLGDAVSVTVTYNYLSAGIEQVGLASLQLTEQDGYLSLHYQTDQQLQLQIIDLLGRTTSTHTLSAHSTQYAIEKQLPKGVYILVFGNKKGIKFSKKIIITNTTLY